MKRNRTIRHFLGTSAKAGFDGEEVVPKDFESDPTFVPRLSFKPSETPHDLKATSQSIARVPENVSFFLDTNMWDNEFDPEPWSSILSKDGNVYVIPSVRLELQGWVTSHPDFIGSKALASASPPLVLMDLPSTGSKEAVAYRYYVSLLQARRRLADLYAESLLERTGMQPTQKEVIEGIQRLYGERSLGLVYKYGKTGTLDQWATDESLVYFAAEHALTTGRPTVILTKDKDILEQFYKLWWFLDTHYRGMLMAEEYDRDPFRYRMYPLPDVDQLKDVFEVEDGFLLDRGPRRMREVLPKASTFVSVECWHIGNNFTRLVFGAEREMKRLLDMKGSTGGLVSDRLHGRNLHPWLAPLPIASNLRNCIAIVNDRPFGMPDDDGMKIGRFDVWHAISTHERFTRIVGDSATERAATTTSKLWTPPAK